MECEDIMIHIVYAKFENEMEKDNRYIGWMKVGIKNI